MGQQHKHAELIKAWADGAEIQCEITKGNWCDVGKPDWHEEVKYRIKPEPPKYPQTRMNGEELFDAFYDVLGHKCTLSLVAAPGVHLVVDDGFIGIANAAIARAIEDGDIVVSEFFENIVENVVQKTLIWAGVQPLDPEVMKGLIKRSKGGV